MHYETAEGPTLQPMRPGLPYTSDTACRELLLAIVAQGLQDDDDALIVGPDEGWFNVMLRLLGIDDETALQIKLAFCLNLIDPRQFHAHTLGAARYPDSDEAPTCPKSWGRLPG